MQHQPQKLQQSNPQQSVQNIIQHNRKTIPSTNVAPYIQQQQQKPQQSVQQHIMIPDRLTITPANNPARLRILQDVKMSNPIVKIKPFSNVCI